MRLLNGIRYAGARIKELDRGYSKKIQDMYDKAPSAVRTMGYHMGGVFPSFELPDIERTATSRMGKAAENVVAVGYPAISAAAKYGAPAAGITLAGKGIYDLINRSQSQPNDICRAPATTTDHSTVISAIVIPT